MSPERAILRDLLGGQSTAGSIAIRVGMETDKVTIALVQQRREAYVASSPLMVAGIDPLKDPAPSQVIVWRLTEKGQQLLSDPRS